jgi:hypothetical protein
MPRNSSPTSAPIAYVVAPMNDDASSDVMFGRIS